MTPQSKPCACGRPGCLIIRRRGPREYQRAKYASMSCARWHRNRTDPRMREAQRLGGRASAIGAGAIVDDMPGSIVTPVEWLDQPSARIRLQRRAEGIAL